jgi:hypothetical protein
VDGRVGRCIGIGRVARRAKLADHRRQCTEATGILVTDEQAVERLDALACDAAGRWQHRQPDHAGSRRLQHPHGLCALPGSASGVTERHSVRLPDGTEVVFENRGDEQLVKDAQGRTLGGTLWTPTGPEPLAIAKPAFAPAIAYGIVDAALTLYSLYTVLDLPSLTPVFTPGTILDPGAADGSGEPSTTLLLKDSIPKMCPRYPEVQDLTNLAARQAGPKDAYGSAALYGTAVHSNLKDMIDAHGNPAFVSETSFLKAVQDGAAATGRVSAGYGERGSIRIDVLEKNQYNTICVYDIKTGKSGLTPARMREIARSVRRKYGGDRWRIVVIEVRPQ